MHADLAGADVWVIDASVAVEYLVALAWPAQAAATFRGALERGASLWAPDLFYPESISALRRLVAMKAIRPSEGARAVQDLARLPVSVSGTASLAAVVWSLRASLTAYDACYVALARALHAPLVTGDAKLARALRGTSDRVVLLGRVL